MGRPCSTSSRSSVSARSTSSSSATANPSNGATSHRRCWRAATGSSSSRPSPVAELGDRCLYLCTPDRPDLEDFIAACIGGGVDIVQLRDKQLDAKPLLERARLALRVCRGLGVPFILNDRPDLALEVGADGVHVGQDDAPPSLCRRILGPDAIVGYSTHAPAELDA